MKSTTTRYILAATLGSAALSIGALMQYAPARTATSDSTQQEAVAGGGVALPADPVLSDIVLAAPLADLRAVVEISADLDPVATPAVDLACKPKLAATPAAAAMVTLSLDAPCHMNAPVTFHHNGMMFTLATDDLGLLQTTVPSLSETALFMADLGDGQAAVAKSEVSSFIFYDRAAVQWQGDSGLELHAREFSEAYSGPGHVWRDAMRDVNTAATGKGGMMVRLGDATLPDARLAEVYTYPSGTSQQAGEILLTVEAEITATNCDSDVAAQSLQARPSGRIKVQDLSIAMPECDAVGDFLVLKNLLEDLTIAAN